MDISFDWLACIALSVLANICFENNLISFPLKLLQSGKAKYSFWKSENTYLFLNHETSVSFCQFVPHACQMELQEG